MEMARCSLEEKGLPKKLWPEVVYTAVHIQNRGITKAVKDMTPLEAWSRYKPSIKHFCVFGSIFYFHIQGQNTVSWMLKLRKEYL